jgi:hypothetical protein
MLIVHFFLVIYCQQAQAQFKAQNEPDPWCVDQRGHAKIDQLQCLRATVEASALRQILTDTAKKKREPPPLNPNGEFTKWAFLKLFHRPILVFEVLLAEHGGYNVHFIFKNYPRHEFLAWFAPGDDDSFALQMIANLGSEKKSAKIRRYLQKNEFQSYWLP